MTIHQLHQPLNPRPPRGWTADAACQDVDPGLFFPISWDERLEEFIEEARGICQACPVRAACLDWALRTGEPEGMWGGTTPEERRRIRARLGRASA